jgi:hypothetical protein
MHGRTCVVRVESESMGVGCQMEASERLSEATRGDA